MDSNNTDIAKRCEDLGVIAFDGVKQPEKKRGFSYEKKKPKNCTTCKVIAYSASVLDFNSLQAL